MKIEHVEVFGLKNAMRGMRNPKNSWSRNDSTKTSIGDNDKKLATTLTKAGTEHRKFLRMIHVQADLVDFPMFWWKEYDTYKIGTVANSCSTMHKLGSRPLTGKDFTLSKESRYFGFSLNEFLIKYNHLIDMWTVEKEAERKKMIWRTMIEWLPMSYNQTRTIDLNYEVLLNIYRQRRNHKLKEWHYFCDWIENLPNMKTFLEVLDVQE